VRKQIKEAVAAGAKALVDESHFPMSKVGDIARASGLLTDHPMGKLPKTSGRNAVSRATSFGQR
jgi:hypothetical protein